MIIDLAAARATLNALRHFSDSTLKFQDDVMHRVEASVGHGNCIIEVGCYHGGLTAQFALVAKRLGQHVHVIDISRECLDTARRSIMATSGEVDNVSFHLSDFEAFTKGAGAHVQPSFALIDGDHRYDGVVADIAALLGMRTQPFAVAFHDYGLRFAPGSPSGASVDRAIHDLLGRDFPHVAIGEFARSGGPLPTTPRPGSGHYFETGLSEGVLIEFREMVGRSVFAPDRVVDRVEAARYRAISAGWIGVSEDGNAQPAARSSGSPGRG